MVWDLKISCWKRKACRHSAVTPLCIFCTCKTQYSHHFVFTGKQNFIFGTDQCISLVGPRKCFTSIEDCPWARNRHSQLDRLSLLSLDKALLPVSHPSFPGCWLPQKLALFTCKTVLRELVRFELKRAIQDHTVQSIQRGFTLVLGAQEFVGHSARLLNTLEHRGGSVLSVRTLKLWSCSERKRSVTAFYEKSGTLSHPCLFPCTCFTIFSIFNSILCSALIWKLKN